MKRNYCFTQQQLLDRVDTLLATCSRDRDYLCGKGFKYNDVEALIALKEEYLAIEPDSKILRDLSDRKVDIVKSKRVIVKQVRLIQWHLGKLGSKGDESCQIFENLKLHNISHEQFMQEVRLVQSNSVNFSRLGISATVIAHLSQLMIELGTKIEQYEAAMLLRKAESEKRTKVCNEMVSLMSDICTFGKLVFKYVDNQKYNDYIMY